MKAMPVGALAAAISLLSAQAGAVSPPEARRFEAAHFDVDAVSVFPRNGREFAFELPRSVPATVNLIGFASNGRSAYIQVPAADRLHVSDELVRVDFSPVGLAPVPGSAGLGDIISVADSIFGNLFVGAMGRGVCGVFEIDTSTGTNHPIMAGPRRGGGGCVTQVEPNGKHVLMPDDMGFRVLDSVTGKVEFRGSGRGTWSPDGNWLASAGKSKITVFNARDFSVRGRFGASSVDGHLVWSPDSKRILFVRKERRCFLQDDFESIAMLDIETGKKGVISSSHCAVTNSQIGWIDVSALATSAAK